MLLGMHSKICLFYHFITKEMSVFAEELLICPLNQLEQVNTQRRKTRMYTLSQMVFVICVPRLLFTESGLCRSEGESAKEVSHVRPSIHPSVSPYGQC